MTKINQIILGAVLLLASLSFPSCEGPEGPPGKDGVGTQGPKGDPGEPGTANVIYSEWKSVTTNMWERTSASGVTRFRHDITAPPVDQAILDRGLVLVYVKLSQDNNQIRPLPHLVESSLIQVRLDYSLSEKKISIWSTDLDQGRNLTPPDGQYRYVIVPGAQAGRIAEMPQSYEDAVRIFNLAD
ncbi:MAG: hypothetical protein WCY86_05185 [Spirosomataceae bacterium]